MKILILANNIKPDSGWGRHSLSVIKEFRKMNLDVSVMTEKNTENEKSDYEIRVLDSLALKGITGFVRNIFITRSISKRFDVIHAFDGWPYGIYGYFAVLGTKKKLFINGIGTYSVAPLRDLFKGFLLKIAYRRATMIFCISNYVKQRIVDEIPLKNIAVVHMGSTLLPAIIKDEVESYKKKYNIDKLQAPILLTVGAIKERKGQYDTLVASSLLKATYPNYLYIMVGSDKDAPYINMIKKFALSNNLEKNIKIINNARSDKDLSFFYNICDIFLLNSNNDNNHFEGFGLVFLEAAQFGKPLIGSRDCGIGDAIEDGYNGYLTSQKDSRSIYNAIVKILENKEIDLNKNSKEFFSRFSWASTAKKYAEYYYSVVR